MMVKVTAEKLEDSQILLNIEVEQERLEKSIDKVYRRMVNKTAVPGFRKGKVPRTMFERYVGRNVLLEQAIDQLLPEVYDEAIKEQGIDPIDQPKLEITQVDPVVVKAVVPLQPKVELGDYQSIHLELEEITVTPEEVDGLLERLREQSSLWVPADRSVQWGDRITLNVEGEGGEVPSWLDKTADYLVSQDPSTQAPGFNEQLVGMAKDESKEVRVSFPPDHENAQWAGKEMAAQVTVLEVKERRLPELDDEFAKGVGEGFENLSALRDRIAENLRIEAANKARISLEAKVIQAVVSGAKIEFPPTLAERELDRILEEIKSRVKRDGLTFEHYLKLTNKTEDQLKEELIPGARERVKKDLVLDKVAEAEAIAIDDAEIDEQIGLTVKNAGEKEEEWRKALETATGRKSMEHLIRERKVIQRLVDIATSPIQEGEVVKQSDEEVESND